MDDGTSHSVQKANNSVGRADTGIALTDWGRGVGRPLKRPWCSALRSERRSRLLFHAERNAPPHNRKNVNVRLLLLRRVRPSTGVAGPRIQVQVPCRRDDFTRTLIRPRITGALKNSVILRRIRATLACVGCTTVAFPVGRAGPTERETIPTAKADTGAAFG